MKPRLLFLRYEDVLRHCAQDMTKIPPDLEDALFFMDQERDMVRRNEWDVEKIGETVFFGHAGRASVVWGLLTEVVFIKAERERRIFWPDRGRPATRTRLCRFLTECGYSVSDIAEPDKLVSLYVKGDTTIQDLITASGAPLTVTGY